MPLYLYECMKCGRQFDVLVPRWEDKKLCEKCPDCGGESASTPAAASFILKGGGFYKPSKP